MTIFASLKYFNKMLHNTLEVESIIHNQVKYFIRVGGSMVETKFYGAFEDVTLSPCLIVIHNNNVFLEG